jgi:hypothetical protein
MYIPRDGDICGPVDTASEIAGESMELSACWPTDADDKKGLVVVACVRLGDVVAMLACSRLGVDAAAVCASAGVSFGDDELAIAAVDDVFDSAGGWLAVGVLVTAAVATAAYFNGGNVGAAGREG